jgi:Ca2+-dependent lipid-binding protein
VRVQVGVHLSATAPGVTHVDFAFAERPQLDVQLTPLGMELSALPGVAGLLNRLLTDELAKTFVTPNRESVRRLRRCSSPCVPTLILTVNS